MAFKKNNSYEPLYQNSTLGSSAGSPTKKSNASLFSYDTTKKSTASLFSYDTHGKKSLIDNGLHFGIPLQKVLRNNNLPYQLVDLLVCIAREVHIKKDKEVFRKNGSLKDVQAIVTKLEMGEEVDHKEYSLYTLASVVKRFLRELPDGIFIRTIEQQLLSVRKIKNRIDQHERINSIITPLQPEVQQLLTLLFGTWFVIILQSDRDNAAEAVAKSVAGSLFRTCSDSSEKIQEEAVPVLKIMINDFGVSRMFGAKNINYFTSTAKIHLTIRETCLHELQNSDYDPNKEAEFIATNNFTSSTPMKGPVICYAENSWSPVKRPHLYDEKPVYRSANLGSSKKIEQRLQKKISEKKKQFLNPVMVTQEYKYN